MGIVGGLSGVAGGLAASELSSLLGGWTFVSKLSSLFVAEASLISFGAEASLSMWDSAKVVGGLSGVAEGLAAS